MVQYPRNESTAYQLAKKIIKRLPHAISENKSYAPPKKTDLYEYMPSYARGSFDADGILNTLCDQDSSVAYRPEYGDTLKTIFATIGGHEVGILMNDGVLMTHAAIKGTAFIHA